MVSGCDEAKVALLEAAAACCGVSLKGATMYTDMVVSLKIRGPQYRPHNTISLNIGTSKKVPLILRNPHIFDLNG